MDLMNLAGMTLNMNQFVEGHQITQHSAIYVKKNFPSFQIY